MNIHLLTEYFDHSVPERKAELDDSLNRNIQHASINKIWLVVENGTTVPAQVAESPKVEVVHTSKRATFRYFFELINRIHEPNTIYSVSNLDIYFDQSIELLKTVNWRDTFVCLTRWNLKGYCGTHDKQPLQADAMQWNHADSHDSWITSQPVNQNLINQANFTLGLPGCDGKICYWMQRSGYRTINPCREIKSYHNHLSGGYLGHRTYHEHADRLGRPYGQVKMSPL